MTCLSILLLFLALSYSQAFRFFNTYSIASTRSLSGTSKFLFGFGGGKPDSKREQEKEEQFRIQQEILARRKRPQSKEDLIKKVDARREKVAATVKKTVYSNLKDNVDPLEKWKEAKKGGFVKDLGYKAVPKEERGVTSVFGVNIPIPLSPIDRPEMDNGERFDLRLPYAERGYVDEDPNSLSNILGKFFGSGKSASESGKSSDTKGKKDTKRK